MYLCNALQAKSATFTSKQQYSVTGDSSRYVFNVVDVFTAHVSKHNRNTCYATFQQALSATRIMIAITSLGMGVNVLDVERVCIWKFPIGKDLGNIWQRLGRGGQGHG